MPNIIYIHHQQVYCMIQTHRLPTSSIPLCPRLSLKRSTFLSSYDPTCFLRTSTQAICLLPRAIFPPVFQLITSFSLPFFPSMLPTKRHSCPPPMVFIGNLFIFCCDFTVILNTLPSHLVFGMHLKNHIICIAYSFPSISQHLFHFPAFTIM